MDFLAYKSACRLARASPVFTRIVQKRLYLEVVLEGKENACKWLESDSTIRAEFATRTLALSAKAGQLIGAEVVEKVLVSQTSALKELGLFHVERVKSSSLNAFTGQSPAVVIQEAEADGTFPDLLVLSLDKCDVKMDDSADKPTFRLDELVIYHAAVPSPYLSDLMASSRHSLRSTRLDGLDDFDWNPIASTTLPQLRRLHLAGPHIPALPIFLSGCENLKRLRLDRYNEDPPIPISDLTSFSQLAKELASLPKPTLTTLHLVLEYYGRNGGNVTRQEVEDLIELPSLSNLENLTLHVPMSWTVSDVEGLRKNKGKKGKLVIEVEPNIVSLVLPHRSRARADLSFSMQWNL